MILQKKGNKKKNQKEKTKNKPKYAKKKLQFNKINVDQYFVVGKK
jgi:hypothetical protein